MNRLLALGLIAILAAGQALADPVLRWAPADTSVVLGDEATIAVFLDDTLTVRSLQLQIDYDASIVTSVGGEPGALFDGFNLFQGFEEVDPESPGSWLGYCVILGAGEWTVGPGELYRWTIHADEPGVTDVVTAQIILIAPGGVDYTEVSLPATTITVSDPTAVASAIPVADLRLRLQPNPFNPRTQVGWDLGRDRAGWLEVLDVGGRRVSGPWRVDGTGREWDGCDALGRALPSGVYTFVLTTATGRQATARGSLVR